MPLGSLSDPCHPWTQEDLMDDEKMGKAEEEAKEAELEAEVSASRQFAQRPARLPAARCAIISRR